MNGNGLYFREMENSWWEHKAEKKCELIASCRGQNTIKKPQNYAYFISSAPILDFTASESLTRKIGSLGRVNWAWKEARERNGVPAGELGETGLVKVSIRSC